MTNLEVISESFQGLLAQACLSALLAIVGVAAAAKVLKKIRVAFSSLWRKSRIGVAAISILSLSMALWGNKTNLLRMIIHPGGPPVVVSAEDILRGFRLEGIVTNDEPLCDMPVDAVEYPPWRLRAGRHTEFTLDLGDFVFPYGTNVINRFRVLPGGTIETFPAQGARVSICAARDLASLSPGVSRFWSADANGGAEKVLRWDSVFANDDRTGGYSAEIRLSANGDFSTRSNEVESVFRRVSPHDWDGDGLANEIDANPYESDGDFFGPANILPEGANSNAYCSVSVLVSGADALVSFVGDKPSNYPDPQFIARHGVTNNVSILIGKTYDILCDQPFAVVGVSDPATEILVSEGQVRVVRPVEIECVQEPGTGFSMNVNPSNLGGAFSWNRDCCQIVSNVTSNPFAFSFVESLECICLGCQARGEYEYEGYSLAAYGRMCPCYRVGDEPNWEATSGPVASGVSAAFTTSVVIFEDAYENSPGEWMPKRSTRTRLNVRATGGPNGGTLTVDTANISKLNKLSGPMLPAMSVPVPAENSVSYSIVYEAGECSATTNDISVVATFTENMSGEIYCTTTALTSVKVELSAIYEAPENPCANRHVYGVGEKVRFGFLPENVDVSLSRIRHDDGNPWGMYDQIGPGQILDDNPMTVYVCPISANFIPDISVSCAGVEYKPVLSLVEPQEVICRWAGWDGFCPMPGEVGGMTLVTTNYVGPMYVSFRGILVAEIPCEESSELSGFYASNAYNGQRGHNQNAGAGNAIRIKQGNYWTVDRAGNAHSYSNWSAGRMAWKIPIGWCRLLSDLTDFRSIDEPEYEIKDSVNARPLLFGGRNDLYLQEFSIDDNGTFFIRKFGHTLERTQNCTIRLDERIIQLLHGP